MGTIGTSFIPELDKAEANGIGQNMLIQRFLRAGRYRVNVGTEASSGRLGVTAHTTALVTGATLVDGGSVRARLAADGGIVFPIEIAEAGTYHLDLLSLAQGLTARLEDDEGWPLIPAGDLSSLDQDFRAGHYRLLVQPAGVAARVVGRLARVTASEERTGHGPFALAFDNTQHFTWHEPPGRDDPRTPDTWAFSLEGPAEVKLAIGDGMVADLRGDSSTATLARLTHATPFAGALSAGRYRIEAASLGRNDRLDYSLALSSKELQPDAPRDVKLPASVPFSIATDRVVSLTSFGNVPVRAVLRRSDGGVVARFGDRGDDWNIGVARLLPAGSYVLAIASASPPKGTAAYPSDRAVGRSEGTDDDAKAGDDTDDSADSGSDQQSMGNQGNDSAPGDAAADDTADTDDDSGKAKTVQVSLALPPGRPAVAADATGDTTLTGGGVHRLTLPSGSAGTLTLAAASSTAELALALERRDAADTWRTVAITQGTSPMVGVPGTDGNVWRASVWTIDGGREPIRFAARVLAPAPQPVGTITPAPVLLDGIVDQITAAKIAVPGRSPLELAGDVSDISSVSASGGTLSTLEGSLILPQSEELWLVGRGHPGPFSLSRVSVRPSEALPLAIPADGAAILSGAAPVSGHTRVWRAASGLGQPGMDAGRGMGVAEGSALALAGDGVTQGVQCRRQRTHCGCV